MKKTKNGNEKVSNKNEAKKNGGGKFGKKVITLEKDEIPTHFYNVLADLPFQLDPPTGDLSILPKIFPKAILGQEMATERFIPIPDEVRELYALNGRPTPLQRAEKLEKAIGTTCRIYFKREDTTTTGSHKQNTAFAQAYYISKEGYKNVATETGAGQWGSALALACNHFGLHLKVFMVKCSYDQKPGRKTVMKFYNAEIVPSPSNETKIGRELQKKFPGTSGSLGMAIAEAIEVAKEREDTVYSLGSVLNHVLLHQTIIGQEVKKQLEKIGEKADVIIGCVGGGSNFGGIALPFIPDKLKGADIELIGVEPREVPSITAGPYKYDYGDTGKQTPLLKMHSLGADFVPPAIHAGGLRYHGMAPIISALVVHNLAKAESYSEEECFKAAKLFAETESIIPAPESSHAIKGAIEAAKRYKNKTIVFNLSGHGLLDLASYEKALHL
ncbi:MAG: TrpB-like pyridoxal phosphate-dependent enzyme [Candidatus Diapherotrites archaeon]|nr:TrpB-like pyridoxal phosphate-dependent enzyme [Candidatus Diapherotrites archaeon]